MTQEEKDNIVEQVLGGFDFIPIACVRTLTRRDLPFISQITEMRENARKLLYMALEHTDQDFWWAGGIGHGGFCAWWDKKRGLSLNYIFGASKVRISHDTHRD